MTEKPPTLDFFPFAYALYTEYSDSYCWNCLRENKNLKLCSNCKVAWYCCQECISVGWKDHKHECAAFKKCDSMPDIEIRLLGRIVTRHADIVAGKDADDINFYHNRESGRKIMDIWAHVEDIQKDSHAMRKFEQIYKDLVAFYGSENLLDKEVVFQLHCRDFINRHAISDRHYLREIGKGLYLDLCAYDHSCAPNTVYVCDGLKATLCPLNSRVDISNKKTTFYSYVELVVAKQQRQKLLRDTWYFDCQCDRCEDDGEHVLTSLKCPHCPGDEKQVISSFSKATIKDPETQAITCPKCKNQISKKEVLDALTGMRFIMDLLDKQELEQMGIKIAREYVVELINRFKPYLTKYNIYYCKLIEALIKLMDPNDHEKVVQLYQEVEPCVRICFPPNHPALAFHLRNIGLELYRLEKFEEAIKYLQEAHEMLKFVMPEGHPLEKSSRAVLATVRVKYEEKRNKVENNCVAEGENKDGKAGDETKGGSLPAPVVLEDDEARERNDLKPGADVEDSEATNVLVEEANTEQKLEVDTAPQIDVEVSDPGVNTTQSEEEWKSNELNGVASEPSPQPLVDEKLEINTVEIRQRIAQVFLDEEEELPELIQ